MQTTMMQTNTQITTATIMFVEELPESTLLPGVNVNVAAVKKERKE